MAKKKYIDHEAFKKKVRYIANTYGLPKVIIEKLYAAMANSTASDVVEVVRCKECRHCERGVCYHPEQRYLIVYADHYCSYGAKMDGKGEGE